MTSAELCGFTLKDILVSKSKKVENNFVEQPTDEFDEIVELNFDIDDEIQESIEASRFQFCQHHTWDIFVRKWLFSNYSLSLLYFDWKNNLGEKAARKIY